MMLCCARCAGELPDDSQVTADHAPGAADLSFSVLHDEAAAAARRGKKGSGTNGSKKPRLASGDLDEDSDLEEMED
jgi:hypothetical protein